MSKLECGECHKPFEGDENYLANQDCWVCPHCGTCLTEPEL